MTLCAKCKIETTFKQRRVRKLPRRFDNSLIDKPVGHRIVLDSAEAFRLNIYLPVIDCLIGELERRFSDTSITVILHVCKLSGPSRPGGEGVSHLPVVIFIWFSWNFGRQLEFLS
jgi:hypothetical protein